MATHGGKRPGAGKPKGKLNAKTLEKMAIQREFNQRVMTQADALFNAQLAIAVGSVQVFRVDEVEDGKGKTKRVHTLVTDVNEIKSVLDEHEGGAGYVGEDYYFVSNVSPQNAAIESMLNRALGKPVDKTEVTGANGGPVEHKVIKIELVDE
jgi:hypothetical protein